MTERQLTERQPMDGRLTPTGVRRFGDNYQDLIAWHHAMELLPQDGDFNRMQVEAPDAKSVDDKMMTQTSLLHLPKGNASHDLAYFLKTTGPNAPSRRPRKVDDHPRRAMSASKNVLKWLKVGQRRPPASVTDAHFE